MLASVQLSVQIRRLLQISRGKKRRKSESDSPGSKQMQFEEISARWARKLIIIPECHARSVAPSPGGPLLQKFDFCLVIESISSVLENFSPSFPVCLTSSTQFILPSEASLIHMTVEGP